MAGGEIELRNRLYAHLLETLHLGGELFGAPASLHRKLGMAGEHQSLADVDDGHVEFALLHPLRYFPPNVFVRAQTVGGVLQPLLALFAGSEILAPHVLSQVEQYGSRLAVCGSFIGHCLHSFPNF